MAEPRDEELKKRAVENDQNRSGAEQSIAEAGVYEDEREALKKAREADISEFDSDGGEAGYGNLHFGEEKAGREMSSAAADREATDVATGLAGDRGEGSIPSEEDTRQSSPGSNNADTENGGGDGTQSPVSRAGRLESGLRANDDGPTVTAELSAPIAGQSSSSSAAPQEIGGQPGASDDDPVLAPVNEAPTDIDLSGDTVSENLPGASVATLSASDPDADDTAAFSLQDDPSGLFEVVGNELRLKDGVALDHEGQASYEITLSVEDKAGNVYTETVTISVADVNEAPVDIILSNNGVDENAAGVVVGTLSAIDPDAGDTHSFEVSDNRFEVVGNELKLKDGVSLNHEEADTVDVTVTAIDAGGLSTSETFAITVADINEAPVDIEFSGNSVDENNAGVTVATLSASDPDTGDAATFSLADDPSGLFEVVGTELKLKDGASLDHEGLDSYDVTVAVEDSAGNIYSEVVTINVADVNEGPIDIELSGDAIDENAAGAVVGTLSAVDPDADDTHTFEVSDDRFEVVGNELKLKDGVSLNHEEADTIDVTVTATDAGGLSTSETVAITVADVNEGPTLGLASGEGLKASYYDVGHSIRNLSEIDFNATPDAEDVVDNLNYMTGNEAFWEGAPGNYFAAKYEGQLVVNEGGSYTINLASDDGSMLFIDGVPVLDNDGLHATRTRSVTVELDEGAHDIEVRYFENGGSQTLQLSWSGPDTGGANEIISGAAFEHGDSFDNLSVPEDTTGAVVATLAVTDPDAGDTHTFTVDDDRFEVVDVDGEPVLKLKDDASLDHETETNVAVSVTVTDAAGASDTQIFSVDIDNSNTAPEISVTGGEGLQASYYDVGHSIRNLSEIDFNAAPDAEGVVGRLNYMTGNEAFWEGAPGDFFAAKYEGQLLVEEGGSYTINLASDDGSMLFIDGVAVLDNDGLHGTRTRSITLDLDEGAHDIEVRYFENGGRQTLKLSWSGPDTDGAEQVIGGEAFRLPGVTDGDRIGVSENVAGDGAALLSIVDAEGDSIVYGVDDDRFEIVETDHGFALQLKSGETLDHEIESEINVTVTATDEHGESSTLDLSIPVADVNEAPFDIDFSNAIVSENAMGATVGTLTVADPDVGDTHTFEVSDDRFEVVGNELKLKDGVSLDHEAAETIDVTVTATDAAGLSTSETLEVVVADVNEAPTDVLLAPAETPGVLSLNQDGGNDDVAVSSNLDGFPTDAITVEVTFASSQTDVGNGTPLFSYAASTGSNNEALIWLEGGSGNVSIFLAGQKFATGIPNASLLDGEQHTVSFTWDQTGNELKVYVDGDEEFASTINIRDLRADGTVTFGQEQDAEGGAYDVNQIFEGEIAEVRIFDHARTGEEIAHNAGSPLDDPSSEAGLVTNWLMNEETGGVVEDLAGNNDLQLQNDASIEGGAFETPTVVENQAGAVVGTLSANDPQTGGAVTDFSIADDPSGIFEIVGNELKLKDGVSTNFEGQNSHEVTVIATGADGAMTEHTVTVTVANVDEAPVDFSLTPVSTGANALSLNQDGGNDEVAVSSDLDGFPTDAITVEVTFASSQTDIGNGTPLFSYAASTGSNNEALIWLEGGSGNVSIYLAGGRFPTDISNASLLDGEQHTVSFTWDQASNELKVYVDGDEEFSSNINIRDLKEDGTVTFGQEQDAEGGAYDANQVFEGEIAEVRIFDHARTGEEIADNAGALLDDPSSEAGLVTNWVMNEETGGVVEDLAGNNDLQLQNGASIEGSESFGEPTVTENNAGAVVGTLSAIDPHTDEAVTDFSISDDPSGMFEVVGNELKLKDGASADYEGQTSYEVTVTATGSGGEETDHTFTVNIADVDEAPTVTDIDLGSSNEDTSVVITEAQLLAGSADPEGAPVSVADLSVDPLFGAVANNGDGTWTFTPADDLSADNVEFTFSVSDGAQSTTGSATIDITAVADAPTLTIGAVQQIELGTSNTVSSGFEGGNVDTSAASSAWIGSIGDWRTTSDAIEIKQETLADGSTNQFIELNDDRIDYYDDATNIFQVIDTQDGATYTINFDHAARPGYNDSVNEFEVVINGDVVDTFSADGTGSGSINWLNDSVSFVGDGSETTVEFRASGVAQNYGRGMYLDDVSITEDLPVGVVSGSDGGSIALPDISVTSNDADGSETLSTAISEIPDGFLITDGINTFTAGAGENEVDISDWAHDQLSVTPADGYSGEVSLTVTATSADSADQAQAVETITIDVQSNDELLNGTNRIDILDGGAGNDTIDGGLGNDVLIGGDGSDVFVYAQGDGADVIDGGAGGWTDAILIEGGVSTLGEFGVDWTIELTEGALISQDSDGVIFSEDSAGSISLNDGTTLEFENLEQII
ncbi:MAG: cadherin domain-containing protein [Pseudomonadota bacterium]